MLSARSWWELLLGVVAVVLIDRNRRFLVGEPARPELRAAAVDRIEQLPEVDSVRFLRLVFVGPKQLFLVASVDLAGDQVESALARTLRRLEEQLQSDPYIVDAVLTIAEPDELDRPSSPFLTFSTCLRSPSVAVSVPPLSVALQQEARHGDRRGRS